MAFVPPTFNLTCDIFQPAQPPPAGPPLYVLVPCQKYTWSHWHPNSVTQVQFRFPLAAFAALNLIAFAAVPWVIECPAASGHFFEIVSVGIQHEGLPNSYWIADTFELNPAVLPGAFNAGSHLP